MGVASARGFFLLLILVSVALPGAAGARLAVAWDADSGSAVQLFEVTRPWAPIGAPLPVGIGSKLNFTGGRLYAVSRLAGTVTVIDPLAWRVEESHFLGPGSFPLDIAVAGDVAYLTTEGEARLLRLDLTSGAVGVSVDFSPLADSDGLPDLGTMIIDRDRLLVQVRRLNGDLLEFFQRPAYIAVVDLASETLVDVDPVTPGIQGIALRGTAPFFRMQIGPRPRRLFVSASMNTHNLDAGIEMIDLDSLQSLGIVAAENDPPSNVCCDMAPFVMVSRERGYFTVSTDSTLSSHLHFFDIDGGIDPADLYTSVGYEVPNLVHDRATDHLFLPTLEEPVPGFHVFDAATGRRLSAPIVATPGQITDLVGVCCAPALVPASSRWSLAALALLAAIAGLAQIGRRRTGSVAASG